MAEQLTTRDIGLAIREALEEKTFRAFDENGETTGLFEIEFVDVSDPHNPIIQTSTNQLFQIRIFAK